MTSPVVTQYEHDIKDERSHFIGGVIKFGEL